MNTIGQTNAISTRGGVGPNGYFYTGETVSGIKERLDKIDMQKAHTRLPYMMDGKLVLPTKTKGQAPDGAEDLPVNMGALKNIVDHFVKKYPKHASKEFGFVTGGFSPPGYVQVTARNSGLGIYYNQATGEPMGK